MTPEEKMKYDATIVPNDFLVVAEHLSQLGKVGFPRGLMIRHVPPGDALVREKIKTDALFLVSLDGVIMVQVTTKRYLRKLVVPPGGLVMIKRPDDLERVEARSMEINEQERLVPAEWKPMVVKDPTVLVYE